MTDKVNALFWIKNPENNRNEVLFSDLQFVKAFIKFVKMTIRKRVD
jgi:hypothetical protein